MPRIRRLLEREGIPASFFYPAVSALLYPDEVRTVAAEGHEIGIHSWIHEANTKLPPGVERDLTFRAADTLETIAGVRPVGIRMASWDFSVDTMSIIRELGLLYDSSLMADDDPYELEADGEPTGVVELPPEWIRDDAVGVAQIRVTSKTVNSFIVKALLISGVTWKWHFLNHAPRLFHAVGILTVVFGPTPFNMGGAYEYALRRTACGCYVPCSGGFQPPLSRRSALRATQSSPNAPCVDC